MRVLVTPSAKDQFNFNERFPWRTDDVLNLRSGFAGDSGTQRRNQFQELLRKLPTGWHPDAFLFWGLEYHPVPQGVEQADCLTAAVIGDWNLGGQAVQTAGGAFDLLLADGPGCERLRDLGFKNVRQAPLWSFDPKLHRILPGVERDLDIVMVGNFNHFVQHERAPWIARVAKLSRKYRVCMTSGVHGEDYTRLMNRAKIVFNRSIRGEVNMRAYEAPACGALMFYERNNPDAASVFTDRKDCVFYGNDDLEELLAYYLDPANTAEREAIARAGNERIQSETTGHHFAKILDIIEEERYRALHSRAFRSIPQAQRRKKTLFQWLNVTSHVDLSIAEQALVVLEADRLDDPAVMNGHACLCAFESEGAQDPQDRRSRLLQAVEHAERALRFRPGYVTARVNLAEFLLALGETEAAAHHLQAARETLDLEPLQPEQMEGPYYPRRFDYYTVNVERAWMTGRSDSQEWVAAMQCALIGRVEEQQARLHLEAARYEEAAASARTVLRFEPNSVPGWILLARAAREAGDSAGNAEASRAYDAAMELNPMNAEIWTERIEHLFAIGLDQDARRIAAECSAIAEGCPPLQYMHAALDRYLVPEATEGTEETQETETRRTARIAALPDWSDPADWQPLVAAYARSFGAEEPVTLTLAVDETAYPALDAVLCELSLFLNTTLELDPAKAPDICLEHIALSDSAAERFLESVEALIATDRSYPARPRPGSRVLTLDIEQIPQARALIERTGAVQAA